jgi:type IV secretory pathway protease TraF
VDSRWVVERRREMRIVVIYAIIGLVIVTGLVTLLNYAMYNNSSSKQTGLPVAILTPL